MERRSINHPLTFPEIQSFIETNQLSQLGRNSQQEKRYQTITKERGTLWESPSDFILHDKFKLDYIISSSGKRMIPRPLPEWTKGLIKIVPNDFPYNFDKNIIHLILWKIDQQINENDILDSIKNLKKQYSFDEFCYFINPLYLKSIPDLDHAHLILHMNPKKYFHINSSSLKKGLLYSLGGISFLMTIKFLHTTYLFHSFVNELIELNKSLTINKFLKFSLKYFIPFPFNFILNQIIQRMKLTSKSIEHV